MTLPLRNSRIKLSQGQLFWREVGQEGPILVFLHGSWHDSAQWVPVLNRLGEHYHCFALDLLGVGESERPNIHYSIALQVECLEEFFATLNQRQVFLIGHSLGAWVAASYALKYMEHLRGLVLLAPEGVMDPAEKNRWRKTRFWMRLFPVLRAMRLVLFPLAKVLRCQSRLQRSLSHLERFQQFSVPCQLLFQRRHSEVEAELLQERLSWLKIPVLILQGEQDSSTALSLSQVYARAIPEADFHIIPDAGHELPEAVPDVVVQYLGDFVNKVDGE